jgi:hypothetical protein
MEQRCVLLVCRVLVVEQLFMLIQLMKCLAMTIWKLLPVMPQSMPHGQLQPRVVAQLQALVVYPRLYLMRELLLNISP